MIVSTKSGSCTGSNEKPLRNYLSTLISLLVAISALISNPVSAQFTQQGNKLVGKGAVNSPDEGQGFAVSISSDGNTAIVGDPLDNNSIGAAWIYTRSGGVWSQQGNKLVGKGAVGAAEQGLSVAISGDGNTVMLGGGTDNKDAGAAWVFVRSGGVWTQQGNKLVGTGGSTAGQGSSVSLSYGGDTAIVGGPDNDSGAGAAWIFARSGTIWNQQGNKLVGTGTKGTTVAQGRSVSISGDGKTVIIGGPGNGGEPKAVGAAWIFTLTGGVWTQQGSALVGTGKIGNGDIHQGQSVSISSDGNTAILGGPKDDNDDGALWVFTRSGGVWTQQGSKLVGTGASEYAFQGFAVSLSPDGNTAIAGGPINNNDSGAAWIFTRTGTTWAQVGGKLMGTGFVAAALQGNSVAISSGGSTAIIGGPYDNNDAGAAWVFINGNAAGIESADADVKSVSEENAAGLKLYPNPARDNLVIEYTGTGDSRSQINVYNLLGQMMMRSENPTITGTNILSLSIGKLATGIYVLVIETNGQKQYRKFLISR
jgi:hypothetical protein